MTGQQDPVTVVASSAQIPWSGRVWRCHHRSRSALNADGSLAGVGGRFNVGADSAVKPPFQALYTSLESAAALLEAVRHLGYLAADTRAVVALDDIAMRVLSQLDISLQRVFDFTGDVNLPNLLASSASYPYSQKLAAAALIAGAEGILVPSATGIDRNLVGFIDNVIAGSRISVIKQIADLRPIITTLTGGA